MSVLYNDPFNDVQKGQYYSHECKSFEIDAVHYQEIYDLISHWINSLAHHLL